MARTIRTIQLATCSMSFSFMPMVVNAPVPMRGLSGLLAGDTGGQGLFGGQGVSEGTPVRWMLALGPMAGSPGVVVSETV